MSVCVCACAVEWMQMLFDAQIVLYATCLSVSASVVLFDWANE